MMRLARLPASPRRARGSGVAGLALLLAGCAVGPNYKPPSAPANSARPFVSTTGALTTADAALPDRWWRLYDDPDLDRLVSEAFAANTDLRQAIARLDQARAVLTQARAQSLPATLVSGGARYRRGQITGVGAAQGIAGSGLGYSTSTGAGTGTGSGTGTTSGGDTTGGVTSPRAQTIYSGGFDIAYELDLFGRIRRTLEAARADADAQAAAADYVRVTVAAETTRAYAGACAAAAEVAVAQRSVDIVRQTAELYRRQLALGAAQPADYQRVAALADQAAAAIPPLENDRRAALFNLALLTGKAPADVDPIADRCAKPPRLVSVLPIGDGAGLIARRPDIRQAERTLAAQTARIGIATADLFPRISLGGSVAATGTGIRNATSRQGLSFALGPLVSWTFPNILAAKGEIAEARAVAAGALAAFDGAILNALNETERALTAYATESDRNASLRRARDEQQAAFNAIVTRARLGANSPIDLLDAERTLVQAESDLAASDAALVDDTVSVFKALGGGWQRPRGG